MKVATIRARSTALDGTQTPVVGDVEVTKGVFALAVAVISLVSAILTTCVGAVTTRFTEAGKLELEKNKLRLESRKASADLYQRALAIDDEGKRHKAVQFLLKAGLVDANPVVTTMPAAELPHVPAATP